MNPLTIISIIANWKTTVAGLGALATGIGLLYSDFTSGTATVAQVGTHLSAVFAGFVGLFAKDANAAATTATPAPK